NRFTVAKRALGESPRAREIRRLERVDAGVPKARRSRGHVLVGRVAPVQTALTHEPPPVEREVDRLPKSEVVLEEPSRCVEVQVVDDRCWRKSKPPPVDAVAVGQ